MIIYCTKCKGDIAEICKPSRIRKGAKIEGTCAECQKKDDMPDFFKEVFVGRK